MSEILTSDEIDQLLNAISKGDTGENDFQPANINGKIKIYDFKRPDVFSKEQLRTITDAFEIFAKNYANVISEYKKIDCTLEVESVDQLSYEYYIRSIPTPSEVQAFSIKGNKFLFETDPAISFELLNAIATSNRDLNKKELKAWNDEIVPLMTKTLKKSLNDGLNTNACRVVSEEFSNNPQSIKGFHENDIICMISMKCELAAEKGHMNLCLPVDLVRMLCNEYNGIIAPNPTKFHPELLDDTKVPIEVVLGGTNVSLKDVRNFGEGSIIELDKLAGEPVDIKINGKVMAKGEVIVIDENFGVRIVECIDK